MEEDRLGNNVRAIVIGGSAGSLDVLFKLLPKLRNDIKQAIIIVLHRRRANDSLLTDLLSTKNCLPVREAEDKEPILPGHIYVAPSDYHLLVERNFTFSLDYSEKVNYSRPSLDVTFESAADAYKHTLVGVLLSGANEDGTKGLKKVKMDGGIVIVQDPDTAQMPFMPTNAINNVSVDFVFSTTEIATYINLLGP